MKADQEKFFDDQAELIFKELGVKSVKSTKFGWSNYDCIYQHPETKAKVFVGGQAAANDKKFMTENNVKAVINCTNEQRNVFENQKDMFYTRICISTWEYAAGYKFSSPKDSEEFKNKEIIRYVDKLLDIIDDHLDNSRGVLIHCLAGAHRAGTTGVLFIMGKMRVNSERAKIIAKSLRGIINPIGRLQTLLERLDKAVKELNEMGALPKTSRWYRSKEELERNEGGVEV